MPPYFTRVQRFSTLEGFHFWQSVPILSRGDFRPRSLPVSAAWNFGYFSNNSQNRVFKMTSSFS